MLLLGKSRNLFGEKIGMFLTINLSIILIYNSLIRYGRVLVKIYLRIPKYIVYLFAYIARAYLDIQAI
jgi:hypothetical protein